MTTGASSAQILVLDDDDVMLELAKRILERAGHRVTLALNSDAARAAVAAETPDLIIIDYSLGTGSTGLDFFRSVRADGFTGPAILVTGFTDENRVIEALRAGVVDILPKSAGYIDFLPPAVERIMTPIWLRRQIAETEEKNRRESYYKSIAEAIPHLVWTANAVAGFEFFSTQWLDFTGVALEEQLGFNWIDAVVHRDERSMVHTTLTEAMTAGERFEVTHRLRAADGEYRWFRSVGVPFWPPGSVARTWFGTSTDIHEQKIAQDEREGLLLSERAARAEAELAVKLKDEFVVTLSHELRTPLHAILGWTEILRRDSRDEARREKALDVIFRNAQIQAQMVSDLLEMSSILSGRMRLDLQAVELSDLVEHVMATVLPTAEAKDVMLGSSLAGRHSIRGDPSRLQQVIWNLLVNAIKFTPRGGSVQVSVDRVGDEVELKVTDNGKGIALDFLPHVFDRFRQEEVGLKRDTGGLGLGLSIVKQLTELHGGNVSVHSDGPGTGATFRLSFPLPDQHAGEGPAQALRSRSAEARRALSGIRVLVVDDESDARDLIEQILVDSGATVTLANGGAEALAMLDRVAPDLLLSDVGMPGMDGYEFIRKIRSRETLSSLERLPAIALTALARPEDRQSALLAGFQSHISKPVNASELIVVCAALIGRTSSLTAGV